MRFAVSEPVKWFNVFLSLMLKGSVLDNFGLLFAFLKVFLVIFIIYLWFTRTEYKKKASATAPVTMPITNKIDSDTTTVTFTSFFLLTPSFRMGIIGSVPVGGIFGSGPFDGSPNSASYKLEPVS